MRRTTYRYYAEVHRVHDRLGFTSGNCPFCQRQQAPPPSARVPVPAHTTGNHQMASH